HVLVVEDSITSRHTIAMQLAAWNVKYDTSDDGVSALAMMRARAVERAPYDLVIADQHLPGIDGTTLARLGVANRKDFGSPRFVLMTASHQPLDTATLAELGVGICLRKPIKPAFLFSAVFGRSMEERPPAARPARTEAPVRQGTAPRILVADDNVVNQKVALRQLERLGYAAETVGDGIEVLDAMRRITYDLVLMDCQMPELDGYETTAHIRRLEQARGTRVPVIALTASAGESDRQACLAAGMDDFLPKPVRENELAAMLQRWLPRPAIEDPKDNS
ncbi:MAG TPA: response regulator, partial [Thermoanaerobaculia bacterium]|nr:response regulator [Thermoanaerobaculia bacterium]